MASPLAASICFVCALPANVIYLCRRGEGSSPSGFVATMLATRPACEAAQAACTAAA